MIHVEEQQHSKYGLRSDTTLSTNCLERISKRSLRLYLLVGILNYLNFNPWSIIYYKSIIYKKTNPISVHKDGQHVAPELQSSQGVTDTQRWSVHFGKVLLLFLRSHLSNWVVEKKVPNGGQNSIPVNLYTTSFCRTVARLTEHKLSCSWNTRQTPRSSLHSTHFYTDQYQYPMAPR